MERIFENFTQSVAYAPFTGIAQTLENVEPERGMGGGCIQMAKLLQHELRDAGHQIGTLHASMNPHVAPICLYQGERYLLEPTCIPEEPISIDEVLSKGQVTVNCYPYIPTDDGVKPGQLVVQVPKHNPRNLVVSWDVWSLTKNEYCSLGQYIYPFNRITKDIVELDNPKYVHTFPRKHNTIRLRFLDNGTFGYISMDVIHGSFSIDKHNQPTISQRHSPDTFLLELGKIAQQLNLTPEIIFANFQRAFDLMGEHLVRIQIMRKGYQQSILETV